MFFTIGQAAAMIGITPKTLRIWEKQGKIEPAQRTIGGHRRYTHADIKKIPEGDPIVPMIELLLAMLVFQHTIKKRI